MNPGYFAQKTLSTDKPLPLAVNIMGLLILVMIGRAQEFIPGIIELPLAKWIFVLLALLIFSSRAYEQDQPFSHPQIKAFLLLFALGCVSILTSLWPSESWRFMSSGFLSIGIFLFFLVKVCVSWRALWRICWALVATAMLLSMTTLLLKGEGRSSLVGTAYDPNDLAFVLVILLPFFYFMMRSTKRSIVKLLLIGGIGIQIVTIMATQSRGGFIGLMVVVGAILIHEKVRPLPVVMVGGVLCLILSLYAPSGYWDRMSSIGNREQDYNMTAESGRVEVWKRGIGFMFENPLLGVGPSAFSVADGMSRGGSGGSGKWSVAHNSFVHIGAELGLTGLFLFLWMIKSSLKALRIARNQLPAGTEEIWLLRAIEVGFYGYASAGFFLSMSFDATLYLLVGLSVVVTNLTRKNPLGENKTGDDYAPVRGFLNSGRM